LHTTKEVEMLFKRLNRTLSEDVFIYCRNDEASNAWIKGAPVVLQADGTRDGVDAVRLLTGAAAKSTLLVGVAHAATASGEYGKVQIYGLRTDCVINQAGTASDANGAVGDVLTPWTASNAFSGAAAGAATGYSPWAVLMQTVASSGTVATVAGKVFLRCM
jgi:hypothetical protein